MMADPTPIGGSSLLDERKGPSDTGMQQVNTGFSSLSFGTSSMPNVGGNNNDNNNMSISSQHNQMPPQGMMDGSYRNFVPRDRSQSYTASPMSPAFSQTSSQPQLNVNNQGGMTSTFASSPGGRMGVDPVLNTPISLDGRPLQQMNTDSSFMPSRPSLDTDGANQIGQLGNTGLFLLNDNDNNRHPPSTIGSNTPRSLQGSMLTDDGMGRERSFSSPGNVTYNQQSVGNDNNLSSPQGPTRQILYENRPISWNNQGSGVPAPSVYRPEGTALVSPSNYSRPPRHGGAKENDALPPPGGAIRHASSDGNFNMSSGMTPMAGNMHPMVANNIGYFPQGSGALAGSPNAIHKMANNIIHGAPLNPNDRPIFGSMDALHSANFQQQYQMPQSAPMPPSGMVNPNMQQGNYFMHQPPAPTANLQTNNSTGSAQQHVLINERGEIVGHNASPIITHKTFEGYPPGQGPQNRPQRAHSYHDGNVNQQVQPQQSQQPIYVNRVPFQIDGPNANTNTIPSSMDHAIGSIGNSRQHERNNTEPIPQPVVLSSSYIQPPRRQGSGASDISDQLSVNVPREEPKKVSNTVPAPPEAPAPGPSAPLSYAARLMMAPRPQPVVAQTMTGQAVSAGVVRAKSGSKMVYFVKFKRSQRNFVLGPKVQREIKIGAYVKVEADRGEDLGIVMKIRPMEKYLSSNNMVTGNGDETLGSEMKRILRVATSDEVALLDVKSEEEDELLRICSAKSKQRGLPMTLVDAEYQYDRNKLTFYFESECRIDFRELVRDLFSIYKTRIWMEQIDKNGAHVVDDEDEEE